MITERDEIRALKLHFENYLSTHFIEGFPPILEDSAEQIMKMKGKRIRPLLLLLTCELYGKGNSIAMGPAAAIEVYHNFSLVHDDIIDKADIRRGQPTVHKVFGVDQAILTGDAMLLQGYKLLSQGPVDKYYEMSRVFTKAALEVIEGEQEDVDFEDRGDVSEEEYLKMIEFKTSVLIAASVQIGGIIGEASAEDQKHLYDFGLNLGLAFQIMDDYLDTYGDESFGKRIGGDILLNKKTYLLVTAMNCADENTTSRILELFDEPDEQKKLAGIMSIYKELGIKKKVFDKMEDYYQKALVSLEKISLSEKQSEPLRTFAQAVYKRNF